MSKVLFLLVVLVCAVAVTAAQDVTQGSLFAHGKGGVDLGACPLKTTSVKTDISGFIARVRVRQEFENKFTEPIEAVYTFPLSQNGAVDDMTMTIGSRVVRGKIMKRDDARSVYEQAKVEGKTASLLDQQRPNIFTQSVANIVPGENVIVEISYIETLKYEDGAYEFVFPMTVGPRYIPGSVTDAAKIRPPVAADRPGHDISIEVNLNSGVPVEEIRSTSHEIQQTNFTSSSARVTLKNETTIPNKDFILRYDVTGKKIEDAVLATRDGRGGFFTMILQPPDKIAPEDRTPKEIVFVLDTSGSMSGFPIEKAKEAMKLSLDGLYPEDTFNFVTFAGDTDVLFDEPVPATAGNVERALAFLEGRASGGGTEMMKAIKVALDPSDAKDHLRIVCFMTDGFVGNEEEIIAEVRRHPQARVFSFGIGSSVNRYLLDKIAEAGNGEAEYVALTDDGSKAAKKFYERVRTPLLTDLSIDWNGMPVADLYPNKLSDLFSAKPVIINGRYTKPASGTIRLKGKIAGQEYSREIAVNLPEADTTNEALATLWARQRVDQLMALRGSTPVDAAKINEEIAQIGLEFRLLTDKTSFVAVEDRIVNRNGQPVTIQVPVAIPEGVDPVMSGANVEVNSTSSTVGTTITTSSISNLPINGRAVSGLYTVAPSGVSSAAVTVDVTSSATTTDVGTTMATPSGVVSSQGFGYGTGSGSGNGSAPPPPSSVTVPMAQESVRVSKPDEKKLIPNVTAKQMRSGRDPSVAGSSGPENSFILDGVDNSSSTYGKAVLIVEPEYPEAAKDKRGEVGVEIEVDTDGNVVSARATSGPESFKSVSESAAKLSGFAPSIQNGLPVRFRGTILYRFTKSKAVVIVVKEMKVIPPTAGDKAKMRVRDVMNVWLYEAIVRLNSGSNNPSANETRFMREGRADIRIVLDQTVSAAHKKRLASAGMEIESTKGSVVKGRIPLARLAGLASLAEVKYVSPTY